MWKPLIDSENLEIQPKKRNRFIQFFVKYKKIIYVFTGIFMLYILFLVYYETNHLWKDNLDCSIINDEQCKALHYEEFNPNKLFVVDVNLDKNNFIMRSNIPIFNGTFSEEKLLKEIENNIKKSNLMFKGNYSLYIISLLKQNKVETCYIASEKCNAKNATIVNQPIYGSSYDPYDFPKNELEKKLNDLSWNTDDLINRIKQLNQQFKTMKNTIFLIHCKEGNTRTSEYVAAYRMSKNRNSFETIMNDNLKTGPLLPNYIKMIKWTCLYYENVMNYKQLGCYDYKIE